MPRAASTKGHERRDQHCRHEDRHCDSLLDRDPASSVKEPLLVSPLGATVLFEDTMFSFETLTALAQHQRLARGSPRVRVLDQPSSGSSRRRHTHRWDEIGGGVVDGVSDGHDDGHRAVGDRVGNCRVIERGQFRCGPATADDHDKVVGCARGACGVADFLGRGRPDTGTRGDQFTEAGVITELPEQHPGACGSFPGQGSDDDAFTKHRYCVSNLAEELADGQRNVGRFVDGSHVHPRLRSVWATPDRVMPRWRLARCSVMSSTSSRHSMTARGFAGWAPIAAPIAASSARVTWQLSPPLLYQVATADLSRETLLGNDVTVLAGQRSMSLRPLCLRLIVKRGDVVFGA